MKIFRNRAAKRKERMETTDSHFFPRWTFTRMWRPLAERKRFHSRLAVRHPDDLRGRVSVLRRCVRPKTKKIKLGTNVTNSALAESHR